MTKRDEKERSDSYLNKAADDEMIFVLWAKDPVAPGLIRRWCLSRIGSGLNTDDDPKILEALACAAEMERQLDKRFDFSDIYKRMEGK